MHAAKVRYMCINILLSGATEDAWTVIFQATMLVLFFTAEKVILCSADSLY